MYYNNTDVMPPANRTKNDRFIFYFGLAKRQANRKSLNRALKEETYKAVTSIQIQYINTNPESTDKSLEGSDY